VTDPTPAVEVRGLTFHYRRATAPALRDVHLTLAPGRRCLLVGANGAGKSTLLHVLGGKHLIPVESVRVLGRPAFHDTSLAADVVFLGGPFPFDVDIRVAEILDRTPGIDRARLDRLTTILGVDREWHMHRCSDGQRRRVQILLGLVRPARVVLLDEITTDLDLIARVDLLELLRGESEAGATLVYATHILDGLDGWATDLAYLDRGRLLGCQPIAEIPELAELRARNVPSPLLRLVERWMRSGR
jgi:CCR4-NOT complex subunit CAF16